MKKYKITATATFEIVTEVEANTKKEAEQIAQDREVDVCIHGSEFCENKLNMEEFTLEDGTCDGFNIHGIDEI